MTKIKITKELLDDVKSCCHNGHGASIFADGTVMFAINSNDVVACGKPGGGWEYRVAYIDNPDISADELDYYLNI